MGTLKIQYGELLRFVSEAFKKVGFGEEVAAEAAETLLVADLRGHESHGCNRLDGYLALVKAGRINPKAKPSFSQRFPAAATLNADGGLGLYMGKLAMRKAIGQAMDYGSGWVAVNNSSHFGVAVAHAQLALEKGLIGFAVTNASPLVSPTASLSRKLGTNPICYVIPTNEEPPFILDMATTVKANGKLEVASREGKPIPAGWAQDAAGEDSTDANVLKKGGSMLPLGGRAEGSGYKGYGLSSVVDILSGVLSGASYGEWVPPFVSFLKPLEDQPGRGIGHFFGAWHPDAFCQDGSFTQRMDHWIRAMRSSARIQEDNPVMIPGDPERLKHKERMRYGIPLRPALAAKLRQIDKDYDLGMLSVFDD